jgi:hypothetical protein
MNDNQTHGEDPATIFEVYVIPFQQTELVLGAEVLIRYLMEELGLDPSWINSKTASTSNPILELHDIENSLSALVAAIFWIGPFILHLTSAMLIFYADSGTHHSRVNCIEIWCQHISSWGNCSTCIICEQYSHTSE